MLSERQTIIFKAIVDEFIKTAEPVGSKTLVNSFNFPYSSATIRNDMVELEEEGLLEKTHTSSGRVPSSKGYRYYVENLLEIKLDQESKFALQSIFEKRSFEIEDVIKKCSEILSQMTNLTSVVLGPDSSLQCLAHIKLFPIDDISAVAVFITDHGHTENRLFQFDDVVLLEDLKICCDILNDRLIGTPINEVLVKLNELQPILAAHVSRHEALFHAFASAFIKFNSESIYFAGKSNMLSQPEFNDMDKARKLIKTLDNESVWRRFQSTKEGISIRIGDTSDFAEMENLAVVSSKFNLGNNESGQLMVIGPNRMAYDRVVGMMEYMIKAIEEMYIEDKKEIK